MIVEVYSDASHCDKNNVAACGFAALSNGKLIKHEVMLLGNVRSVYLAEFKAAINGLQYGFLLDGVTKVILYTDCLSIVDYRKRMRSKRKSFYVIEFIETIETILECGVEVECVYVKAHSDNKMNNFIDQSSRKELRMYLKTKQNKQ